MTPTRSLLAPTKPILWIVLFVIFGLGLGIRLYDLTDPPLDFHATRQLHSAIKARSYYYQWAADEPEWQRQIAMELGSREETIEPPILEFISALTYRAAGGEYLWIARLYSTLFWLIGGIGLFLLARTLAGIDGAIIGLLYYLILPFGIFASRAFQPDPLMSALILFSLWSALRWQRSSTWGRAIAAGLLAGLAILSKAVAVFFVGPALAGMILAGMGLRKAIRSRQVWAIGLLAILPYAVYFIYASYIAGFLDQGNYRFFPHLWVEPAFYLRWIEALRGTVIFEWVIVALLGIWMARQPSQRGLLAGAWIGYAIYSMTLPYHTITHSYYQLPIVGLVGLGLALAASAGLSHLQAPKKLTRWFTYGLLLVVTAVNLWNVRVILIEAEYRSEATFWRRLGEEIGQDVEVAGLTHDYGFRLAYWGWVPSTNWMTSGDFALRELAGQNFDFDPLFEEAIDDKDIFLVTLVNELASQPALSNKLYAEYPVTEMPGYLIFDLQDHLQE
jgi:4-amino-4-deoxy-L-arabinose transferase-like glycosyltransferase